MQEDETQLVPDPEHGAEPPEPETPTGSGDEPDDEEQLPSPSPGRAIGGGPGRAPG